MKKQTFGMVSLLVVAGLFGLGFVGLWSARAQRRPAPAKPVTVAASGYRLSGPYTHKNLTVFLVHGSDRASGPAPLTLEEAMKQKKVVVHETGNVNRLTIANRSNQEVFVQAGDIVKGGQQDRVLALDLIVPPRSGRMPIDAFCVEHGRWNKRDGEAVAAFSASANTLNSKELKIAAKHRASQEEVWDKVAVAQQKLGRGVAAAKPPQAAMLAGSPTRGWATNLGGTATHVAGGGAGGRSAEVVFAPQAGLTVAPQMGLTVASARSASSLQLTLENKEVQSTSGDYVKQLASITAGKSDVIGYAFAINGQLNSADVYSSHALFAKLWLKLLAASAIEAVGELDQAQNAKAVTTAEVAAFLADAEAGKPEQRLVTGRVLMVKAETPKNLFFETRDRQRDGAWIHRNYLTK